MSVQQGYAKIAQYQLPPTRPDTTNDYARTSIPAAPDEASSVEHDITIVLTGIKILLPKLWEAIEKAHMVSSVGRK